MKKHISIAFGYAIAAMACGVFYREYTKALGFGGVTSLGKVHTHLFMLGMVVFLLAALFDKQLDLKKSKLYTPFLVTYNIGVPAASVMMLARGITQVSGTALTSGADAAISGVSGVAHVITAVGLVLLFVMLIKLAGEKRKAQAEDNFAQTPEK